MGEFTKMIVMHEREFRMRIYDYFDSLTDEERADIDFLRGEFSALFEMLCWMEKVDGILVWYGEYGVTPERLVWLDEADLFAEKALEILKEEVTNYAQATNQATNKSSQR
jgi:hypothetical protein